MESVGSVVEVCSDFDRLEMYRLMVGELDAMLANATEIGDLVLAAHLQGVKDFVQERLALGQIDPNRGLNR